MVNDSKLICYVTYSLSMRRSIWTSIFLNKTLVFTNYCNIVVLFLAMVEKCSRTLIFCLLFCFVSSSGVISLSKGFFTSIIFRTIMKIYLKLWTAHNFICRSNHMLHYISILVPPTILCIIKSDVLPTL